MREVLNSVTESASIIKSDAAGATDVWLPAYPLIATTAAKVTCLECQGKAARLWRKGQPKAAQALSRGALVEREHILVIPAILPLIPDQPQWTTMAKDKLYLH